MNHKEVPQEREFSLEEKISYYKAKWKREHRVDMVVMLLTVSVLMAVGLIYDNGLQLVGLVAAVVLPVIQRNRMMAYVEQRAFDGSGKQ